MSAKTINLGPERWARAERIFDRLAELPPEARAEFLAQACEQDMELRAVIVQLADSDMAENTIVADSVRAVRSRLAARPGGATDYLGERIGPYQLVSLLGSGGMGVVYLAERVDEHFTQQVAVKLVRQRLVDPNFQARLIAERQILADLKHPNIARLYDGGTTADGTPYLVIEYIDGEPIDRYCDRLELGVQARLELFLTVCSAVHHAHQNLIVHRDIKPSNILVTKDGVPKLLDFGIARLLDAAGTAQAGLTRDGMAMLTPESAAPEQLLNKAITTATDIYALGILLYRLLTGRPPYRVDAANPGEIAQAICLQQPERPSAVVTRATDDPVLDELPGKVSIIDYLAGQRGTTPERLSRQLRGDLDTIVLYALRKEPERRYRSVTEFAQDIKRHMVSQPVQARPDTWRYRTGKFVQRHTTAVALSALLIISLTGFGAALAVQNQRVVQERDTAREVSRFLEDIFMEPDPGNARGLNITAREILQKGADNIRRDLNDRPLIQATLMETIGRVYFNLGDYGLSAQVLRDSLRIRRQMLGPRHADVAASSNALAQSLIRLADYAEAERLLGNAIEINLRLHGPGSAQVAANYQNLAELHHAMGRLDAAAREASQSVRIYEQLGELYAIQLAEGKNLLARTLRARNDLTGAGTMMREAIALVRQHRGDDYPLLAYYLQNLAVVLQAKGDHAQARTVFDEAITLTRRVLGEDHDLLGGSLVMLGMMLHDEGEYQTAEALLREALAVHTRARGPDHPFVGYDLTSLAMLLHDTQRSEEAETMLREALRIYEAQLGEHHQYIASSLTELAAVVADGGRASEAQALALRALQIRRRDHPDDHPLVASTQAVYGHTLALLGRYEEAQEMLRASFPKLHDGSGLTNRRVRRALDWKIALYEAQGDYAEVARLQGLAATQ
ncbi:MAG: serine/threonine protein kinase [Gammaproteobacteria bacterium]|nr:serine/threonine protein kinase [Gammaproteobacteria bacterium]